MSQPTRPDLVEVFQRVDGLWEWRRKSPNGQVVAVSGGQGYTTRFDVKLAAVRENEGLEVLEVGEAADQ